MLEKNLRRSVIGTLCGAAVHTAVLPSDSALDPTFGAHGIVVQDFGATEDVLDDTAIQADGGLIGVGNGRLARFRPNGSLDPAFGNGGSVITAPTLSLHRVAVQPDGKVLAASSTGAGAATAPCVVARYSVDGTLDATFGTDGLAILDFTDSCVEAADIAVHDDGTIVTAVSLFGIPRRTGYATVRLTPDGLLDTSFNNTGVVIESVFSLRFADAAIAVQPDGKIVVGGSDLRGYVLFRYNEDGSRDTSFNGSGLVDNRVSSDGVGVGLQRVEGIVVQTDGALAIAVTGSLAHFTIVGYRPEGTRDASFGTDGVKSGVPGTSTAIALQRDGRILVAGLVADKLGGLGLERYNADGSGLDERFNDEGARARFRSSQVEQGATPLQVQSDGRIVLGATLSAPFTLPPHDWLLIRFQGAPDHRLTSTADREPWLRRTRQKSLRLFLLQSHRTNRIIRMGRP